MSDNTLLSTIFILIFLLIIVFMGDPDLMDVVISNLNDKAECFPVD